MNTDTEPETVRLTADAACVFRQIVAGRAPATVVRRWPDAVALVTTGPYTFGHVLVVPRAHVRDAAEDPALFGAVMSRAAQLAADTMTSANILTSWGEQATQSVWHLHVHVVPRVEGDRAWLGLWPWPRWAALVLDVPQAPPGTIAGRPAHTRPAGHGADAEARARTN